MKIFKVFCCCFLILCLTVVPSFALSFTTDSDLLSTSSVVVNLVSLVPVGTDSFVIFSDDEYSYYLFYGDLSLNDSGNVIAPDGTDYVHYYRVSSGSFNYQYHYDYGTSSLNLTPSHIVTSNLVSLGNNSISEIYYTRALLISIFVMLFIISVFMIFKSIRGFFKGGEH